MIFTSVLPGLAVGTAFTALAAPVTFRRIERVPWAIMLASACAVAGVGLLVCASQTPWSRRPFLLGEALLFTVWTVMLFARYLYLGPQAAAPEPDQVDDPPEKTADESTQA